ncbi:MAG: NMD3-related protein [Candidatus Micrarchaeia archaeon]
MCNNSSDNIRFIGEFCEECIIKNIKKNIPKELKIEFCKRCSRLKIGGEYKEDNNRNLAEAILIALNNKNYEKIKINTLNKNIVDVDITYKVDDDFVTFDNTFEIKKIHQICQECYRKSSGYYEALVQLRGNKEKVQAIAQKFNRFITNKGAFISKIDEFEHGFDIYVSDKLITKSFFPAYKLKPKSSYTLYGIKNGRKIYRNTYLLSFD